jgi:hypothetical protein
MKTIGSALLLVVFGLVANFLAGFLLNIAGLPGALLAGTPGKRTKRRFKFGAAIAAVGHSYLYLAYTAFIVNWTMRAARRDDVPFAFVLWPIAIFAVMMPLYVNWIRARVEAKEVLRETGCANPQVDGLQYTLVTAFIAFFIFAFAPSVMRLGWAWVPYVNRPWP